MKIELFSNKYRVQILTCEDIDDIYKLQSKNMIYFEWCPPFVTKQMVLDEMKALPHGKTLKDKYYIGFYQEEKLFAVMDFIDGYPENEIAYIGFFMTDISIQNKGIGTEMIEYLSSYLTELGYCSIRLAWVKGNPQAEYFWKKNKFSPIRETKSDVADKVILAERLLCEKK